MLDEHGLAADDEMVLRRVVTRDGRSRAFINDHPVGVGLLRRVGTLLVEVQGQHEQMILADPASHAGMLDSFGVPAALRSPRPRRGTFGGMPCGHWRSAREAIAAAERDEEWLRHAVEELATLAPRIGEEEALARESPAPAAERASSRGDCRGAVGTDAARPPQRRAGGCLAGGIAIAAAAGPAVSRMRPGGNPAEPALAALERAEEALAEAETLLTRLIADADVDPRLLEQSEERLFALRAAASKHGVAVPDLPALLAS